MASHENQDLGPDLALGIPLATLEGRKSLSGHVGGEPVLLARVGNDILAVDGACTHYSGPLGDGIVVGDTVRCPWHHACFSLRTGEALQAPAFDPLGCWKVEQRDGKVHVTEKLPRKAAPATEREAGTLPQRIVIIGGGAAGFAAAEMLRRRNYAGSLTMLSADSDAPYDRPNLSKDYLAGSAEEAWIPLRSQKYYAKKGIDLQLQTTATRIDTGARMVFTTNGSSLPFDRLLIATGAEPVRLPIPGADGDHVFVLRSLADSRAIIERAQKAKRAVVIGAGFIGLETAAALRERGIEVHVVAPDARPLEKVLGPDLGDFIRSLHEKHGVIFHLKTSVTRIEPGSVTLENGEEIAADLVIVGVGVRPRIALAKEAGLATDRGILVNECLETSAAGIFAAGDAAQWRDVATGETRHVEHWVVAQRHGQVVAENMLGAPQPFRSVPFFWSAHYDVSIRYVGYARGWDAIEIDGSIEKHDCAVGFKKDGKIIAIATIGRDIQALDCEVAMRRQAG